MFSLVRSGMGLWRCALVRTQRVTKFSLLVAVGLTGIAFGDDVPKDALQYLNELPDQALTLDLVVEKAIRSSDSYRAVQAARVQVKVQQEEAESLTDPRATLGINYQDDQREPLIVFSPSRSKITQYLLGYQKNFLSGTALNFDLTHASQFIELLQQAPVDVRQTNAEVTVTQSLWKNAFGAATRARRAALQKGSEQAEQAYRKALNDWFVQISNLFYTAWVAQQQERAELRNLELQKELVEIVRLKLRRGTAERPALLQVQSSQLEAEVQVNRAKQSLEDQWRNLLMTLKLPREWEAIDPMLVPIQLGEPENKAKRACKQHEDIPEETWEVAAARYEMEAAKLNRDSAESNQHPDLQLVAGVGANSVDSEVATTFSDTLGFQNPLYQVGVQLVMPLGNHQAEAALHQSEAGFIRAEAQFAIARDQAAVSWRNQCFRLEKLIDNVGKLKESLQALREREKLEKQRFEIGRSTLLEVTQAGRDATRAALGFAQAERDLKVASWQLLTLTPETYDYLNRIEKRAAGQTP